MLSRRTLIGSSAILAAGCGGLDIPFPVLGAPKITPLTWVSHIITGLGPGHLVASPEEKLRRIERILAEDSDSAFGPTRGRYSLTLQYFERYAGPYSDRHAEEYLKPEHLAAWLEEVNADLVSLWPEEAHSLGQQGILLPLDQFGEGSGLSGEFYSSVLDPYRANGTLYALPVGAKPLMLYFDADYFAGIGVVPPDNSWDWDVLVKSALQLTQREEDGTVSRWGLAAHNHSSVWWALWQNAAEVADALTSQCRLTEPAAIEALTFVRGLIHTHQVSPAALSLDLFQLIYEPAGSPPAMVYSASALGRNSRHVSYRAAELPRGKVRSIPVGADSGIAIVQRTAKPEVAYTALRGLLQTMQSHVDIPASRKAVARLGQNRSSLQPEEVTATQNSMEYGRAWPREVAQGRTMGSIVKALVRGDDVVSVTNQACSVLYVNQRT